MDNAKEASVEAKANEENPNPATGAEPEAEAKAEAEAEAEAEAGSDLPVTRQASRTPFTSLSQVDADLALARALQEQERAYMMLRMNGEASDYGSSDAGSFADEDDDEDEDEDEDDDDGPNEDENAGTDAEEDAFDVHAHADEADDDQGNEFDNDEAYARALQDAEERELAVHLMTLAGINDWEAEDTEDHGSNSQDTWEEVDPDELSYEELLALGEVVGTESRGLSAEIIASLPLVNYKAQSSSDGSNTDQCVICRLDYEDGDALTLLSCKHSYHPECINNWLQINKLDSEVEVAEAAEGGGDLGIVSDDVHDYGDRSFSPAPGIETVCVFPKNAAKLVLAGEETELLVGLNNEGDSNVNVIAIRASVHLPFDHNLLVQNLTGQVFNNASVPPAAQATFQYSFTVNKYLQPGSFDLVGTIIYEIDEQPHQSLFYNGTIEVAEASGFLSIESVFLVTLGIALLGLCGLWIYGQIQQFSKKTKKTSKVEVGTGTIDAASMDEWLQGTAFAQSRFRKANNKKN